MTTKYLPQHRSIEPSPHELVAGVKRPGERPDTQRRAREGAPRAVRAPRPTISKRGLRASVRQLACHVIVLALVGGPFAPAAASSGPASRAQIEEVDMSSATAERVREVHDQVTSCEPQLAFEDDSNELSSEARIGLRALAACLAGAAQKHVWILGSVPEANSRRNPWALGYERARAAADYLESLGVAPQRITAVSADGPGVGSAVAVDAVDGPIVLRPGDS